VDLGNVMLVLERGWVEGMPGRARAKERVDTVEGQQKWT
jgi:hypothetical protein